MELISKNCLKDMMADLSDYNQQPALQLVRFKAINTANGNKRYRLWLNDLTSVSGHFTLVRSLCEQIDNGSLSINSIIKINKHKKMTVFGDDGAPYIAVVIEDLTVLKKGEEVDGIMGTPECSVPQPVQVVIDECNHIHTHNDGDDGDQGQGVVPLAIRQIKAADKFSLFGMSFGMVSIVGIVRNIEQHASTSSHSAAKIVVTLEDHTGQINAHLWLDNIAEMPQLLLNTYARVFGSIRSQGGQKELVIFKIESLLSINELTTHLLEVLNARYMAEDFAKNAGAGSSNIYGMSHQNNQATGNGNTGFGGGGMNDASNFGLTGQPLMVYKAVKENREDQGISKHELHNKFTHIPTVKLEEIIENLTTDGYIYNSIDSDHWIPADLE